MRKFLSLVLALVMMMSLVTINAGAKEFTDDGDIKYEEAVDVISTIGVVDGYSSGAFNPGGNLTRGAAAKIICNLILGPTTAAELHADTAPYRDVPISNDFSGYIAYCQKEGIISGYADGSFRPAGTLTGYAFMKMLLGALGYDAEIEKYVGPNWSINVAKRAIGIGLYKGLEDTFNGADYITREEACLYAFNTLQADLVRYDSRITTTVNGAEVTVGSSLAESRKWDSQATRITYIRDDDIIQFAEEYFNKLEKKRGTDEFERPAYTWIYDKDEIGTYVDWELLKEEYTTEVTGRELYDLLGAATIRDNDLYYYVDGYQIKNGVHPVETDTKKDIVKNDLVRSNQEAVGVTDNGVLTQVFLDKDRKMLIITSIDTWLAKVTSAYDENREYARMDVWIDNVPEGNSRNYEIDIENVPAIEDVKEDEFYLVNVSYKDNNTIGEVVEIAEPEIKEESTVTKFSSKRTDKRDTVATKVTTGGTEYENNRNAYYDLDALDEYDAQLLTDMTYNIYMDQYGYFIGIDVFEGTLNYVFITGFDRPTSNLTIKTADAAGIFLDGSMKQIKVNVTATDDNIKDVNPVGDWSADGHGHTSDIQTHVQDDGANYFVPWSSTDFSAINGGFYALNRWFTYSVTENGVYTLKPAVRMTAYRTATAETIKTENLWLDDNVMTVGLTDGKTNVPYVVGGAQMGGTKLASSTGGAPVGASDGTAQHPNYRYHKDSHERVYGNDDSVYITVDADNVDTTEGVLKAITDVNGTYTGVQNVEIEIDAATAVEEAQVYSVYNKDHYVIGSVVVGEGNGGNATIAYVLSGAKSERKEGDTYYWEFDAVVDGEKQTLTAKGDYSVMFKQKLAKEGNSAHETIADKLYHGGTGSFARPGIDLNEYDGIVELRFDANKEYVTSIRDVEEEDIYSYYGERVTQNPSWKGGTSNPTAVGDPSGHETKTLKDVNAYRINGINKYMVNGFSVGTPATMPTTNATWTDDESPAVTHFYDSAPNQLRLVGRTLYVTGDQNDEGLALSADAKAVTIQMENGKWETRNHSSVAAALNHLADLIPSTAAHDYDGEIVAAINSNGTADWVVFTNYVELRTGNNNGYQDRYDLRYINARTVLSDGISQGGQDNSAGLGELTYELNGTNPNQRYTVILQSLNGGTWVDYASWTVTGDTGRDYTIDTHRVGFLDGALNQWRLVCGDVTPGAVAIRP